MRKRASLPLLLSIIMLFVIIAFVLTADDLHGIQLATVGEKAITTHYVTVDGNCGTAAPCYSNVQSAVNTANDGDEIRVAGGTYTGVSNVPTLNTTNFTATQLVAVTKSITLRGGYTIFDWNTSDPATNETILDAERNGRVMIIMGEISPIIEGFTITNGDATNLGGKIAYDSICSPINFPVDSGGGVYVARASALIRNNKIEGNRASIGNWSGGGGVMLNCSSATITENHIASNIANAIVSDISNGAKGGGILAMGTGTPTGNLISPTISKNTITGNISGGQWSDGGGIYIGEEIAATITDNLITYNTTTMSAITGYGFGGGIYAQLINYYPIEISNNIISYNEAGTASSGSGGGGIYLKDITDFSLVNNMVGDNRANGVGSGIFVSGYEKWGGLKGVNGSIINNTIASNYGAYEGLRIEGSTYFNNGTDIGSVTLINNIIANHSAAYSFNTETGLSMTVNDTYTLWDGNGTYNSITGAGSTLFTTNQITGDAGLKGFGNYHITSGSAAIDAGMNIALNHDIDGNLRPIGKGVDIGADELHIESVIPIGGGVIDGTDVQGRGISIDIPAGAVDQSTTFYLTPQAVIDQPHATLYFAGQIFDLVAEQNSSIVSNFTFLTPVTLTITYADEDVDGIGEDTLQLLHWNGTSWSSDGITFVSRHMANNSLTVTIAHLTEFAMFGESYRVYLPTIVK